MKWFGCAALAVALSVFGGVAHAQQDRILTVDGKERKAKILSEDYNGLSLSIQGGSMGLAWAEVDSIRYANANEYYKAIDAFGAGKAVDSLPLLEALAADSALRTVLRHGVLYHLGLAHQRLGNAQQAIAAYEKLLAEFPKTRYITSVGASLLSLYLAAGDVARAGKVLEDSFTAAGATSANPALQAAFSLLRGRVLEEQKKLSEAERIFESAANSTQADPDTVAAAKLGLGRCAQQAGRAGDAERRYRELVTQEAPNYVLAGAWNGLGDLALEQAVSKRDPDGLRDALFSYLRGVVLYVPGREGPTEEYERALAGSSKAFRAIGELEANAERKKLFLDRAKQRHDTLATEYPNSRYLKG